MQAFSLPPSLLEEITAACARDQIALARIRGFAEGKGVSSQFRLELTGRIVIDEQPVPPVAPARAQSKATLNHR